MHHGNMQRIIIETYRCKSCDHIVELELRDVGKEKEMRDSRREAAAGEKREIGVSIRPSLHFHSGSLKAEASSKGSRKYGFADSKKIVGALVMCEVMEGRRVSERHSPPGEWARIGWWDAGSRPRLGGTCRCQAAGPKERGESGSATRALASRLLASASPLYGDVVVEVVGYVGQCTCRDDAEPGIQAAGGYKRRAQSSCAHPSNAHHMLPTTHDNRQQYAPAMSATEQKSVLRNFTWSKS